MDPIDVLADIIDLLRDKGVTVDDPYDFNNFFDDHASHLNLFETGRFIRDDDELDSEPDPLDDEPESNDLDDE